MIIRPLPDVQWFAAGQLAAIHLGTLPVAVKQLLRRPGIAVDLPTAHTSAVGAAVEKSPDVLRRISQKQPISWGILRCLPAAAEMGQARFGTIAVIPPWPQQRSRRVPAQVPSEPLGPKQVQKRPAVSTAQQRQPQPFPRQPPVPPVHRLPQRLAVTAGTGEKTARFQSRQRGRTVLHQQLFDIDASFL